MSVLTLVQIEEIINAGCPEWVKNARKEAKRLNVHINGVGVADYLNQVNHYENERQYQLRKDFATSNKYVFENILRPVDKVFSAKGGNKLYNTSTDQKKKLLTSKLSNIDYGYSITDWISKIQANKFYSDPNGIVFFEVADGETWPTQKNINSIFNYQADGRLLDWIVFAPEKRYNEKGIELKGDFYRVVDDAMDYLIRVIDKKAQIIEEESYKIAFKRVPAIINSDLIDDNLIYKKSPVDSVVELADHYLNTNSVKNIYEFLHGYPIFWAYVQPCKTCDGTGLYSGTTCTSCGGDGHTFKKDVSDVIKLTPPTDSSDPKIAPDIAGYVQPDLAVWQEQRTELDWIWGFMNLTLWGSHRQEQADNETATAAFIDVQPVNDRLNQFADSFEGMEQLMTDFIAEFYLRDSYKGSSINYGRRYLVETPDQIWNKYEKAKENGSPKISLDYLLMQFYQTEFANDMESLAIAQKAIKLEPFVHKTDEQINLLNIAEKDKKAKFYFNEWFKSLSQDEILKSNIDILKSKFDEYLKTKEDAEQEVQRV